MNSTLPECRLRRLKSIVKPNGVLPIGRSTFLEGVRSGRYPAPIKLGPRITAWRDEDIRKLIEEGVPRSGLATKSGGV
jgi:predicted DNA-binding transcriptional regulator AlpA